MRKQTLRISQVVSKESENPDLLALCSVPCEAWPVLLEAGFWHAQWPAHRSYLPFLYLCQVTQAVCRLREAFGSVWNKRYSAVGITVSSLCCCLCLITLPLFQKQKPVCKCLPCCSPEKSNLIFWALSCFTATLKFKMISPRYRRIIWVCRYFVVVRPIYWFLLYNIYKIGMFSHCWYIIKQWTHYILLFTLSS